MPLPLLVHLLLVCLSIFFVLSLESSDFGLELSDGSAPHFHVPAAPLHVSHSSQEPLPTRDGNNILVTI